MRTVVLEVAVALDGAQEVRVVEARLPVPWARQPPSLISHIVRLRDVASILFRRGCREAFGGQRTKRFTSNVVGGIAAGAAVTSQK